MVNFETKFNFGNTVYVVRQKPLELQCSLCNGDKIITYKDKDLICPECKGIGSVKHSTATEWYVLEEEFNISTIKVTAHSEINYTIKYKVSSLFSNLNSGEINLFATREEAQAECDIRNRPSKRMDLKDIIITPEFNATKPNTNKVTECYDAYRHTGKINKDIIVDKHNVLIDGYVGYLVYKMMNKENVRVLIG